MENGGSGAPGTSCNSAQVYYHLTTINTKANITSVLEL
jgi:hypothetical protein